MGARRYRADLSRFAQRDSYLMAAEDHELVLDLELQNLYAFPGANPINLVELDGHRDDCTTVPDRIQVGIRGFGITPSFGEFSDACGAHDRCYGRWQSWRKICDDTFLRNMNHLCDEQFPTPSGWDLVDPRDWNIQNRQKKRVCRRVARIYHWGVWQFGDFESWKMKARRTDRRGKRGCPWQNRVGLPHPNCLRHVRKHSYPPFDKDPGTWRSRAEMVRKVAQELSGLLIPHP